MTSQVLHAGLIALYVRGGWSGVLIQGASGVGKSDLALRALTLGFRLVADDRTRIWVSGGALYGDCPPAIAGLIEMRGLGMAPQPALRLARIRLAVRCLSIPEAVERMPEPAHQTLMNLELPVLAVRTLEASAPAKLIQALSLLGG
jgi:serine kinase of HPr protein (carbohydrate metabolism regulator)